VARWFTADLHIGHANIIRYSGRPFADVDEMDEALVARWNAAVAPDDEVWVLGDVAMGRIAASLEHVGRLHGHKLLVPGNHDRCWPGHGPAAVERWEPAYRDAGFTILPPEVRTTIGDVDVRCCHFPYEGDSHDVERYAAHRPHDDGSVLMHGHVHDRWRRRGRQINVGVDVWDQRPVAEAELVALVYAAREGAADAA
jgi:calcineurin-like phosphoesterase family protein